MQTKNNTGFIFPFSIHPSPGKGKGVFIDVAVPAQTIIWRPQPGLYKVFDEHMFKSHIDRLSHDEVIYELVHVYAAPEFPDYLIRLHDGGELINHSRQPNLAINNSNIEDVIPYQLAEPDLHAVTQALLDERFALITTRELSIGEELTLDYNIGVHDPDYYDEICERYQLTWPWL